MSASMALQCVIRDSHYLCNISEKTKIFKLNDFPICYDSSTCKKHIGHTGVPMQNTEKNIFIISNKFWVPNLGFLRA